MPHLVRRRTGPRRTGRPTNRTPANPPTAPWGTAQAPSTVQARSAALVRSAAQEHARSAAPDRAHGTAPAGAGRARADAPARDARPRPGLLFVPVRATDAGPVLRMFRTPLGERTAVGFTARDLLTATLGAGHAAIRLAEPAPCACSSSRSASTGSSSTRRSRPRPSPAHRRAATCCPPASSGDPRPVPRPRGVAVMTELLPTRLPTAPDDLSVSAGLSTARLPPRLPPEGDGAGGARGGGGRPREDPYRNRGPEIRPVPHGRLGAARHRPGARSAPSN
ncbi:hypothetical protein SCALM49S_02270 [Streptomyces californicus]